MASLQQSNDARQQAARAWCAAQLAALDVTMDGWETASADASFRRYFRARAGTASWVVMDAPPAREPVTDFVACARLLEAWSLPAPRVLAQDTARGFLLLSDLGQRTMLDVLPGDARALVRAPANARVHALYAQALAWLAELAVPSRCAGRPAYNAQRLHAEMDLFPEWYLGRQLGVRLSLAQQRALRDAQGLLASSALEQPQVFVHRDYHSRNLMAGPAQDCRALSGMLDFQDAVCGPLTYDLVSLLKDCYVTWPEADQARWIEAWAQPLRASGVLAADAPLQRWIDWMGLQRHLKVLGIFARLHWRDGKSGYLADLPRVLAYVRPVLARYSELDGLRALFEHSVWPAVEAP